MQQGLKTDTLLYKEVHYRVDQGALTIIFKV